MSKLEKIGILFVYGALGIFTLSASAVMIAIVYQMVTGGIR